MTQLLCQKVRQLSFMLGAMLLALSAFAGPESGGGGNVCFVNGELRALDVANHRNVRFESLMNVHEPGRYNISNTIFRDFGFDVIYPLDKLGFAKAFILNQIRINVGKVEFKIINNSLNELKFLIVPNFPSARAIGADFAPFIKGELCSPSNTSAAILYNWQLGVVLNASIWNELSTFNQVTLLIHEALRNLQIRYGGGFNNIELQKLTAEIMNGDFKSFRIHFAQAMVPRQLPTNMYVQQVCGPVGLHLASKVDFLQQLYAACVRPDPTNLWRLYEVLYKRTDSSELNGDFHSKKNLTWASYVESVIYAYATAARVPYSLIRNDDLAWLGANYVEEFTRTAQNYHTTGKPDLYDLKWTPVDFQEIFNAVYFRAE